MQTKKRSRCGKCEGCLQIQDCGDCVNCIDKPKFGGPGTRKQVCVYRRCKHLQLSPPKRSKKMRKKLQTFKQRTVLDDHHRFQDFSSTKDLHPPPFYMQPTRLGLFVRHKLGRVHLCKSAQLPFTKIDVQGIKEPSAEELEKFLLTKKQKPRTQSENSQLSGSTFNYLSQRMETGAQIESMEGHPTEDEEDMYPALQDYMKPTWTDLFMRHKLGRALLCKSARSPFRNTDAYLQEVQKPSDQELKQFKTTKKQKLRTPPCKWKKPSTLPSKRKKPLSLTLKQKKDKVSQHPKSSTDSEKSRTHVNLRKRRRETDATDVSSPDESDQSEGDRETLRKQSMSEPRAKKRKRLNQLILIIEESSLELIVCIPLSVLPNKDLTISDEYLGCGSFGEVYKGMFKGNPCAVKIVSPSRVKKRECEILKEMQHPNVVTCLDMRTDPKSGKLNLVMELMERNLTQYLEDESNISLDSKLHLCSDIIDALMYLHAKGIIHRDLTSNNVLLKASTAKLGDFGMVRYLNDPSSLTEIPGTEAYMPPEAYPPNEHYTEALDIFSFGVLAIQIVTQEQPNPSIRVRSVPDPNLRYPQGTFIVVPEIERRKNHIDTIDASNPLRDTALICIADQSDNRPTANEIGSHIRHLMHESIKQRDEMQAKELKRKDQKISELEIESRKQAQITRQQAQAITELQDKIRLKDEVISKWEAQAKEQVAELQELLHTTSKQI